MTRSNRSTALALAASAAGARGTTAIEIDPSNTGAWNVRAFDGRTDYRRVSTEAGTVLEAVSEDSASALYRERSVDVADTPWLVWSWRIERLPTGTAPETERAGDDYGARIYVVREGLFGRLSATALNYVRARHQPTDTPWPNAYVGRRAMMWAVDSGPEADGEWHRFTRNLRADWRAAFGEDLDRIDGVALMTDTDDTDSRARAFYGRIRFCAERDCRAKR